METMDCGGISGKQRLFHRLTFDALLLLVSFALVYWSKRGNLQFENLYVKFLPILFSCWFLATLLTRKFRRLDMERRLVRRYEPFISSVFFQAGMLSIIIYSFEWVPLSRVIVFGSLTVFLLLEILFLSGNYISIFMSEQMKIKKDFSFSFMLLELLLMMAAVFFVGLFKTQSMHRMEEYKLSIGMLMLLWMFTGLLVHRFKIPSERKYAQVIYPYTKSMFVVLSIVSFFIFGFRLAHSSRLLILGSLGVFFILELTVITVHYLTMASRRVQKSGLDSGFKYPEEEMIDRFVEADRKGGGMVLQPKTFRSKFVSENLKKIYLQGEPRMYEFISRSIDLSRIDVLKTVFINSCNPVDIATLPENAFELIINFNGMNRFGSINDYLRKVAARMEADSLFVSRFEPYELRYAYFKKYYPYILARFLFFVDFVWRRIIPTLPLLQNVYATFTNGQHHVLSLAEGFGRIYFCGFEIVALEVVDNHVYFVVRKTGKPVPAANPTYRMVFKQKRVGRNRKFIFTYKIRTMYPYSEYLHQYVIEKNRLNDIGKVRDDFRITHIGRIIRRLWIDELPMIINLLKGDLTLVGVRPLSETFFNLYPPDLQAKRVRFKPGLIPPYYADMPKTIEEIWASEYRYLEKCESKPFKTGFVYFFKAMDNIFFRHAKSG
jgi:hypothetical protein